MKAGYKRWRAGAWRLTVEGPPDPITNKRKQLNRTVRAPNTREGEKQADVELARFIVEVSELKDLPGAGVTVEQLIERWVEHRRPGWEKRSPGQPDATLNRLRNHVVPHIGSIVVDELRPADLDGLYNKLRRGGLAESTVRRIHANLRTALTQAVRWDLRQDGRNPADQIEPPKPPTHSDPKAPTDDVLIALINAASPDMVCYLRLSAVTGARRGQMVALRWSDLDLEAGTVRFSRALAVVKGGTQEKDTKTGHKHGVALDPQTLEIVQAHHQRCQRRAASASVELPPDAYMFAQATTPDGRKPWSPSGANQRFNKIRKKVPGAETVTPHQLRHWMATSMFSDGYDPVAVAGRGGWKSPTVPLRVYGHFRPARDQDAADTLAGRLKGQDPTSR